MTRHFHVFLEWDPEASAWLSYVPVLNGLSTFAETKDEALAATREAITGYIEAAEEEGIPLPGPTELTEIAVG